MAAHSPDASGARVGMMLRAVLLLTTVVTTRAFISSITPTKGSLAGGTLLTISGGGLISNDTSQCVSHHFDPLCIVWPHASTSCLLFMRIFHLDDFISTLQNSTL